MKKLFLRSFLVLFVIVVIAFGYLFNQYQNFLLKPVFSELPVVIEINNGTGFGQFIKQLHDSGGKGSELNWKVMAHLNKLENSIKAGEYEITTPMTPRELITYIDENNVKTYSITIIEGQTWSQIRQNFASSDLKPVIMDLSDTEIKLKLQIKNGNLEGQFLPETYQYIKGDVDLDVLARAHDALQEVLDTAWAARDKNISLRSSYELLILASIIEKETAKDNERNIISGVFNRRLIQGMKLQTDPTVIYGVGTVYAGDITSEHLRTDTPYNTYTRVGLPPTPIAAASEASIYATAHPNDGKELFFVANNKGGHTFSENYEQHKKAVAEYLKGSRSFD